MENFKIDIDADGIAVIAFDVPGRSMNTLTSSVMKEIPELVERIKTDESIKGAVITSGKASGFCAGADLGDMAGGVLSGGGDLQKAFDAGWKLNGAFRALETCGKPVAAAINGLALDTTSTAGASNVAQRFGGHVSLSDSNTHVRFAQAASNGGAVATSGGSSDIATNWGSNTDRRLAAGAYTGSVNVTVAPGA